MTKLSFTENTFIRMDNDFFIIRDLDYDKDKCKLYNSKNWSNVISFRNLNDYIETGKAKIIHPYQLKKLCEILAYEDEWNKKDE